MTKRDYELVARILRDRMTYYRNADPSSVAPIIEIAEQLAIELKRQRSAFDRAKFLRAAGVES